MWSELGGWGIGVGRGLGGWGTGVGRGPGGWGTAVGYGPGGCRAGGGDSGWGKVGGESSWNPLLWRSGPPHGLLLNMSPLGVLQGGGEGG